MLDVPKRFLRSDGTLDLTSLWLTVHYGDEEESTPIKINNWTGNLQNSARQWELYDEAFFQLTGLSPALDGKGMGSGESGYARRLGMVKTEAAVERRRAAYDNAFRWAIYIAMRLERLAGRPGPAPTRALSVVWPAPVPEDPAETSKMVIAEHAAGLRSTDSALRRLNPSWSEEQVVAESGRVGG